MFKKNFEKWHKKYKKKYGMVILDPDGWDRSNPRALDEKITWKEFQKRAIRSSQVPIGWRSSVLEWEQFVKDFEEFYGISFYEYIKNDIGALKALGVQFGEKTKWD